MIITQVAQPLGVFLNLNKNLNARKKKGYAKISNFWAFFKNLNKKRPEVFLQLSYGTVEKSAELSTRRYWPGRRPIYNMGGNVIK
jgi:hypothetical protein